MDYDEEYDELVQWVDGHIFGMSYCEERDQVADLIFEVIRRIPSNHLNQLMFQNNVQFVTQGFNCVAEQLFIPFKRNRDDELGGLIEMWLVCLGSGFNKENRDESLYTISHELAHIFLGHSKLTGVSDIEELKEREIEADKQVIEWGFESELRRTPFNYIYGGGSI